MVAGEDDIQKALLIATVEDADQPHDVNVHMLELDMLVGEEDM